MSAETPTASFQRAQRHTLGAGLWLATALVVGALAWALGDPIFGVAAGAVAVGALALGGYRREVRVSPDEGVVRTTVGLWGLARRRSRSLADFAAVVVRGERPGERARTPLYEVLLAGPAEVLLDVTRDEAQASAWAAALAAATSLEVRREAPHPPAPAPRDPAFERRVERLVRWGALLVGLAVAAGTAVSLYPATTSAPLLDDEPPAVEAPVEAIAVEAEDDR